MEERGIFKGYPQLKKMMEDLEAGFYSRNTGNAAQIRFQNISMEVWQAALKVNRKVLFHEKLCVKCYASSIRYLEEIIRINYREGISRQRRAFRSGGDITPNQRVAELQNATDVAEALGNCHEAKAQQLGSSIITDERVRKALTKLINFVQNYVK